jgi:hypothetical protein
MQGAQNVTRAHNQQSKSMSGFAARGLATQSLFTDMSQGA